MPWSLFKYFFSILFVVFLLLSVGCVNKQKSGGENIQQEISPIQTSQKTFGKINGITEGKRFAMNNAEDVFTTPNNEGAGILATDGKYLYVKVFNRHWNQAGGEVEGNTIKKIGTGYKGTIKGKNYGSLAKVDWSISMTYFPDGYLYNGFTNNGYDLQRINVNTGKVDFVKVPDGLIIRTSGVIGGNVYEPNTDYILITSDGKYLYNLAYVNGFTINVFDPKNNFKLIKKLTVSADSYYTDGLIADGKYLYAIEWVLSENRANKITKIDIDNEKVMDIWDGDQLKTHAVSGQYDWVNNKIWLGEIVWEDNVGPNEIYRYAI